MIVTCTTARTPYLGVEHVRPGTFVAGIGADSAEKSELQPQLLANASVVVDGLEQCAQIGDLHHAITVGAMTARDVHATLAEVVAETKPGRMPFANPVTCTPQEFKGPRSRVQDSGPVDQ
jgi:alanine dehydrogenase